MLELLVVIAIIGVLTVVVLVALNGSRDKSSDAKIRTNLNTIRTQAEIYYSRANTYGTSAKIIGACPAAINLPATVNIFSDQKIIDALNSMRDQLGVASLTLANSRCVVTVGNPVAWAVAIQLKTGGSNTDALPDAACVDSRGTSKLFTYTGVQSMTNVITVNSCN